MKINNTLFVLDTETGGVDPQKASLMEIAGVVLKDGKVVAKYSSLVKSVNGEYNCNDFARSLHGIKDEQIEKEGKFPIEIIKDLNNIKNKFFDGEPMTIVAHNAAFDISFIKQMFSQNGQELTSLPNGNELNYDKIFARNVIDTATMALVLRLQNRLPFDRCSLDNILKFYNINIEQDKRHSALSDAEQTAKAFLCMFRSLANVGQIEDCICDNNKYDIDFDDAKKM